MSNLLEQASLVMIPSGYKEDVVYSVIPTSGAGDLTFTRASTGTRIDSNGNVQVVPWNLFTYSNDFSNSAWTKNNAILTSGQSDPFGGTNAWKFQAFISAQADFRQTVTGASSYSFYAKAGSVSELRLWSGSAGTIFDTSTGTVASGSGTIESIGNGWYRCTILTSTTGSVTLIPYFVGNANDYIYIAFGQAQASTTAKPYFPTTDRLNVPRLTYQNGGGGCPSLLLEKQSTNYATYSDQFDNGAWSGGAGSNATVTANTTISPDGTQNADTVVFGSNGYLYQDKTITVTSSATYSIFAKTNTQTIIFGGASTSGTDVYSYQDMGNGWYRQILTRTFASSGSVFLQMIVFGNNETKIIYGAQLEASSYATSYIPTTNASATRVADACYKTGISSLIGQTEGTIFLDFNYNLTSVINTASARFQLSDGSTNQWILVSMPDAGTQSVRFYQNNNGTDLSYYSSTSLLLGRNRVAVAYKSGQYAMYLNGVLSNSSTSGVTVPATSRMDLTGNVPNDPTVVETEFNQIVLFPTRLTNSELAQLTGNQNYTINQAYESYGVASESPNCVQP